MYVVASSTLRARADARRHQSPAETAITKEIAVEISATSTLVRKSSRTRESRKASLYHLVVNPPQPISASSALNEFNTTIAIGRYRKTNTRAVNAEVHEGSRRRRIT